MEESGLVTEVSNFVGGIFNKTKNLLEEQLKKFEQLSFTDKILLVIAVYLIWKMFKSKK